MHYTNKGALNIPVARTMLKDIAAGKLARGDRISEAAYSARCNVSRTPVRQALRYLNKLKVVRLRARLGARVIAPVPKAKKLLKSSAFAEASAERNGVHPAFVDIAERIRSFLGSPEGHRETIIKDAAIARRLGVSRTTANRALSLLARQNLLEPLPRRGWKRIVLGRRELLDLYEFRMAVEPAALEAAWNHLDRELIEDICKRTHLATSRSVLSRMNQSAMAKLDLELHRAILQACPNALLRRAMEEQEALRIIAISPTWRVMGRADATFEEHSEILDAILKGKKKEAMAALRRHLINARNAVASRLSKAEGKEE
jgi:DNA-binding GntR family transcriptional regulator